MGLFSRSTNNEDSISALTKSAERGNTDAMVKLGDAYRYEYLANKYGVSINLQEAIKWYVKAGQLGNCKAMAKMAEEYVMGDIGERDDEKILYWASKGADLNSPDCMLVLANHIYGTRITKYYDLGKKEIMLKRVIACKDKETYKKAVVDLGFLYGGAYIWDVPEDEFSDRKKAAYCYTMQYIFDYLGVREYGENIDKIGYYVSEEEFYWLKSQVVDLELLF